MSREEILAENIVRQIGDMPSDSGAAVACSHSFSKHFEPLDEDALKVHISKLTRASELWRVRFCNHFRSSLRTFKVVRFHSIEDACMDDEVVRRVEEKRAKDRFYLMSGEWP